MRKLCWLWFTLGLGVALVTSSCAAHSGFDGDSRSASIPVVVARDEEDVPRTRTNIDR